MVKEGKILKTKVKHLSLLAAGILLIAGCGNGDSPGQDRPVLRDVYDIPKDTPVVIQSSETAEPDSVVEESSSSEEFSSSSQQPSPKTGKGKSKKKKTAEPVVESSSSVEEPVVVKDTVDRCAKASARMLCDPRDGEIYRMVRIGSQVWMSENLRFAAEGSWCYNNKADLCKKFGRLYSWTAAVHVDNSFQESSAKDKISSKHRGICPEGWHLPSAAEMNELVTFIGKKNSKRVGPLEAVGTSLKSVHDWNACDTTDAECAVGTNRYGFNAKPAGRRNADGTFDDLGNDAGFWISEESDNPSHAPYWNLYYATDKFWGSYANKKSFGYSVRCIED